MQAFGEVLSASVVGFTAECWPDDQKTATAPAAPRFGSFVRAESFDSGLHVFAVVYNVLTGPQDNLHKPVSLRLSREELRNQQPHIFALLRTEIHAVTIGYSSGGRFFRRLPPRPADVHDFLYPASAPEIIDLTEDFEFVRFLTGLTCVPADELISAAVREACAARQQDYNFLVRAGQSISRLIRDDQERLISVLKKIRPEP